MENFNDERILKKYLNEGDNKAYSFLFKTYYLVLSNYAFRIVRDEYIADDVVQDVFYHLYAKKIDWSLTCSILGYLYKSVYNQACNTLRNNKRTLYHVNDINMEDYISEIIQLPEVELKLNSQDLHNAIQEALLSLPKRCREIFILSKIDNLSNKEIAVKLQIKVKTVEQQMTKAFNRLRVYLNRLELPNNSGQ